MDQLIIGNKASYDDFGASLAKSKKKQPKKKSIKESVPFSNKTYDFTAINGEIYWEERELEYTFEMTAETPEKLEDMKTAFSSWVMNVINEEIHDPFIPDYHFIGTYEDLEFDDDEGMDYTVATLYLTAYPYKIANYPKVLGVTLEANGKKTLQILNASDHKITPKITTDGKITMVIDDTTYTIDEGITEDSSLKLLVGLSSVVIEDLSGTGGAVQIKFSEEVF